MVMGWSLSAWARTPAQALLHSAGGDVPDRHWVVPALPLVVERYQLLTPTPQRHFEGERPLTRYEVAAVLSRLSQILEAEQNIRLELPRQTFQGRFPQDVPLRHWAAPAVKQVLRKGLMSPYQDARFRGQRYLRRFEWLVYLQQLVQALELEMPTEETEFTLKDLHPDDWAYPVAQQVLAWDLLPTPNGALQGKKALNRYDMAHSLFRLFEVIERQRFSLKRLSQRQKSLLQQLQQAYAALSRLNINPETDDSYQNWNQRYTQLQIRFRQSQLTPAERESIAQAQNQLEKAIQERMQRLIIQ